jgi:hypothetical protein
MWLGLIGLMVAIVGAVISFEQARLGSIENQASEQQSLVTLVSGLASVRQQEATASAGESIAALHEEGAADATQGLALVNALHNQSIPAVDNLELGAAFEAYGAWHNALVSFNRAATTGVSDPVYRAKALRAEAAIEYYIGGPSHVLEAHGDTARAAMTFDGQPDVPAVEADQNRELAYLWDAMFAAGTDCARATSELDQAKSLIATDHATEDGAVTYEVKAASDDVRDCTNHRPVPELRPVVPAS